MIAKLKPNVPMKNTSTIVVMMRGCSTMWAQRTELAGGARGA